LILKTDSEKQSKVNQFHCENKRMSGRIPLTVGGFVGAIPSRYFPGKTIFFGIL